MARCTLAVLAVATMVAAVLLFVHPQSSAIPTLALSTLTVAVTAVLRFAGWIGQPADRDGNSA
ncbi:hypothetical protein ABT168_08755 [Streptomyces sp. NPDC001793]